MELCLFQQRQRAIECHEVTSTVQFAVYIVTVLNRAVATAGTGASGRRHPSFTRVATLIVATIYLQLIQNRYMFRSFTVLQCSHQHCVQPVASDVEVVGYL